MWQSHKRPVLIEYRNSIPEQIEASIVRIRKQQMPPAEFTRLGWPRPRGGGAEGDKRRDDEVSRAGIPDAGHRRDRLGELRHRVAGRLHGDPTGDPVRVLIDRGGDAGQRLLRRLAVFAEGDHLLCRLVRLFARCHRR